MTNIFLHDIKYHRPLEGYSGAQIYLCSKDNKNWFVRKIAKDIQSSPRLKLQARKQETYAKLIDHIFETPRVLCIGEIDEICFVDFEFINGADGAYYLRNAELNEVKNLSSKLQAYFEFLHDHPPSNIINVSPIISKVISLGNQFNITTDQVIEKLNQLHLLQKQETLYHGDLSLENILFHSSGKIYLIDLLDAPINHYWMDCSKLFQDLSGSWFIRNIKPLPKSIINYLSNQIYKKIIQLNPHYADFHYTLLLINFLRILPYVQNEKDKQLIHQRINHFQELI